MLITANEWWKYISKLSAINQKAADLMQEYVYKHGYEVNRAMIDYAYSLATKYGEAAAELACIMYDDMAAYWALDHAGKMTFQSAIPAETATYSETAAAMKAVGKQAPTEIPSVVGRLVKQAGADTTLQNALRDGAEFAWIPHGDTCAFCIALASRGWQKASKRSIKNGHAEHIHSNCDCAYGVRFDSSTSVEGYDPGVYLDMYYSADGSTPKQRINSMRREFYAENKEKINAQKRAAYEKRKEREESSAEEINTDDLPEVE